jgi:hypothetical protein
MCLRPLPSSGCLKFALLLFLGRQHAHGLTPYEAWSLWSFRANAEGDWYACPHA